MEAIWQMTDDFLLSMIDFWKSVQRIGRLLDMNSWALSHSKKRTSITQLVVESTHLKNMLVKLDHETPIFRVIIPNIFETTTCKLTLFSKFPCATGSHKTTLWKSCWDCQRQVWSCHWSTSESNRMPLFSYFRWATATKPDLQIFQHGKNVWGFGEIPLLYTF